MKRKINLTVCSRPSRSSSDSSKRTSTWLYGSASPALLWPPSSLSRPGLFIIRIRSPGWGRLLLPEAARVEMFLGLLSMESRWDDCMRTTTRTTGQDNEKEGRTEDTNKTKRKETRSSIVHSFDSFVYRMRAVLWLAPIHALVEPLFHSIWEYSGGSKSCILQR